MPPTTLDSPAESRSDLAERLRGFLLLGVSSLALVMFAVVVVTLVTPTQLPGKAGWPDAVLLLLTAVATIIAMARHLPLQQVLLAATIIGVIGGLTHALTAASAIPFGPIQYLAIGPRFFEHFAWAMPVLWIVVVLNSRGVARLILRPWRKTRSYGFWLLGTTATLAVLVDLALEPYATKARGFWLWLPTKLPVHWFGAPLTNIVGWILVALLILAFATPCLINKEKRPRRSAPDYHPLIVWLLGMILFGLGTVTAGVWLAGLYALIIAGLTVTFALRGARW